MRGWANWISQVGAMTRMGLSTVMERKGSSVATMFGIAGVVLVFVAVLSIGEGFRRTMVVSGDPGVAMVMRAGSDTEMMSIFGGRSVHWIADAPGIARSDQGPLVSAQLFVIINLPKRSSGTDANVPLRGVDARAFGVSDAVRIVAGRRFQPGRGEVIVGVGAARAFAGLDLGATLHVGRHQWKIVGFFEANGGLPESEIWTDAVVLQGAYERGNSYQSVLARLQSPEAFGRFREVLEADPRLNVKVVRQTDYFIEQSRTVYRVVTGLGVTIAALMAVGAVFGALNTMYTAVSARTREIATFRALGFGGGAVMVSVLAESLCLALIGGGVGGGLGYVIFDGFQAATMNWQSFSQVAFQLDVTPGLLFGGVAGALMIGLIGGVFPAVRAASLPVAMALRA
ncbi:MAG TPA: ABC transporter permease [Verrucomicrobiae bacterium]|nr:ABC transporter permease [Verrucomicrobiae bacterium]